MNMFIINNINRLKNSVLWCLPLFTPSYDDVADTETAALLLKEKSEETGEDRLRAIFSLGEYGTMSKELNSGLHAGLMGLFFGSLYGGVIRSRRAYQDFLENNQATAFKNHYDAKKHLQDYITVNFAKGAFSWGWRLGMFTGSFVLISTCISAYRGKFGILEYSIAGGVSGSFFRTHLGLRGMLVGGLLGTALGTIGGGLIFVLFKVSGLKMEDVRDIQYAVHDSRVEARKLRARKLQDTNSPEDNLLKHHQSKIEEGESANLLKLSE